MRFLFQFLPFPAFGVFLMNDFFDLGFIPIAVAIAMLFVSAYSVWIYFQERKQIRILIKPARRFSWPEIAFAIIITALLIVFMVLQYNEDEFFHQTRNHGFFFTRNLFLFLLMPYFLAVALISMSHNPARNNRQDYLFSYIFLESGLKIKGLKRKMYPWDHFTNFEVVPLEHTIILVFRNGEKLTLKINKYDFNLQLLDIKLFLGEKISAKNIPTSS